MNVVMEGHRSFHAVFAVMEKHLPHIVRVTMDDPWGEPSEWCKENIGVCARTTEEMENGDQRLILDTTAPWCRSNHTFGFKDPAHATAFRLVHG